MTTVLVVDDSKLARIVVGKAISNLQPTWQRIEASTAAEAIAILGAHQVSLALVDYNMPGRNGLELAAEIRKAHPDMPIAVITANMQIARAVRAAGAEFINKPITDESLREFVTAATKILSARPG